MENLKALRIANKLTQEKVSNALGIGRTTYTQYETGASEPDIDMLLKLADYFNVTVDYIIGNNSKKDKSSIKIPVFKYLKSSQTSASVGDVLEYEEINTKEKNDFFGLIVNDISMKPLFCVGDIVIIQRQQYVESGEIAAVLIGNNSAIFRKVIKQSGGINMVSLNTSFDPEYFSFSEIKKAPVIVLGKIVELRRKF